MTKILITGANGLLGQKLVNLYQGRDDVYLIATGIGENRNIAGSYTYDQLNITSPENIENIFSKHQPDVVINTAAMTHVDECELDPDRCWKQNVHAVSFLIAACKKNNSFLIHLSTDFIFDGKDGPYKEGDSPNPLGKYAESKLESERLLAVSGINYAIARTMLIYGVAQDMSRSNIVLWVKKSLEEKKQIKLVNDQWRMPTLVENLANGCALIADKRAEGIFHISGKDMLSPYDMGLVIADFFGLDNSLIQEVNGDIFTQPAKRPTKTGFILDKANQELGYNPVSFKEGLAILESQLIDI